jgi:hypothetical protein
VIKEPSTTGTNKNVPKNPSFLIWVLAVSKILASVARKQAIALAAPVQLRGVGQMDDISAEILLCLSHNLTEQQL